jgi:hypothetical protein
MRMPRLRFTLIAMMIAVAAVALLIGWLRPISEREAVEFATQRLLQIPGASEWAEQGIDTHCVRDHEGTVYWCVTFAVSIGTGAEYVVVLLDRKGNVFGTEVGLREPPWWISDKSLLGTLRLPKVKPNSV